MSGSSNSRWLALTPGDPDGIGPEILWKVVQANPSLSNRLLCFGSFEGLKRVGAQIDLVDPDHLQETLHLLPPSVEPRVRLVAAPDTAPRKKNLSGFQSGWAIEKATRSVLRGTTRALVTGPISKEHLKKGGFSFPGHTEFLAHLCKKKSATMMLTNSALRVSLVTVHAPLRKVASLVTPAAIQRTINDTYHYLVDAVGIGRPRIAVLALNPHAGEHGLLGTEEKQTIMPTLRKIRVSYADRAQIDGPFAADTFFALNQARSKSARYDAVIAMYHDQGLVPVKLLDFTRTVNVTLGLPITRTSVDHGTGFDIAGKGIADPSSLEAAIELADKICQRERQ